MPTLKEVADRAGQAIAVTDQNGTARTFKLLNTAYLGIRKLHTDVQGVASTDSGIVPGMILTMPNGDTLTVSMHTTDYHRGQPIRFALDLVENNNTVTVTRPTVVSNGQGGITGKTEAAVYVDVPVKIGTVLQIRDGKNDSTDSQFGMLLSSLYPVEAGDILRFGSHYADAKVEGVKLNYEGIYEIAFDKEPRWS